MADSGNSPFVPYRESFSATLRRTLAIAVGVTTILAVAIPRTDPFGWTWLRLYPTVLWVPLGGHYVELFYLNVLRPRCTTRGGRIAARLLCWLIGGIPLGIGAWLTWTALGGPAPVYPPIWLGGPLFVVVETIVHSILWILHKPNFFNGRG